MSRILPLRPKFPPGYTQSVGPTKLWQIQLDRQQTLSFLGPLALANKNSMLQTHIYKLTLHGQVPFPPCPMHAWVHTGFTSCFIDGPDNHGTNLSVLLGLLDAFPVLGTHLAFELLHVGPERQVL